MPKEFIFKKASEKEITLYSCLGECLCAVQILEDAISHSIVIKKTNPNQKEEADILLEKHRRYVLGKAIKIIKDDSLLPTSIENELSKLLKERNWLIHHSITENKKEFKTDSFFNNLSERTKEITFKANNLRALIELDLIEYCEKKGINMSRVKKFIEDEYGI